MSITSCPAGADCSVIPTGALTNLPAAGGAWSITDDPLFDGDVRIPAGCRMVVTYTFAAAQPGIFRNSITLASAGAVVGRATTVLPLGNISGIGDFVWLDASGDGRQSGEVGLGGVTVELWSAASGQPGVRLATATTGSDGDYFFGGLAAAAYFVRVTDAAGVLAGLTLTSGSQSKPNPFGPIPLAAGQAILDADFGYTLAPAGGQAIISGIVWNDLDGDGLREPGEPGIPGVRVCAEPLSYAAIRCAETRSNGVYLIQAAAPATYLVAPLHAVGGKTGTTPLFVLPVAVRAGQRLAAGDFGYK